MAQLDPNIQLLSHIRLSLFRGESLKACLREFCREKGGNIANDIASLLVSYQQNKKMYDFVHTTTVERGLMLDLIWRGLHGDSIIMQVAELENELEKKAHIKIDQFIKLLPIKVLLVVMLFHFPALLILGFLPIINQLLGVLQ